MGLLTWLGLRRGDGYPNLDALVAELRRALPDDESVVIRYIAVVIALLGKVACADGRLSTQEEAMMRDLLAHVDRLSPSGVEAVCGALHGKLPRLTADEEELCYREIRALCDGKERLEVMRLLARLAAADGGLQPEEEAELKTIAEEIGIEESDLLLVEREALDAQPEKRA